MTSHFDTEKVNMNKSARLPILFLGHGNPMHTLSKNRFTSLWQSLGQELPRPRAILMISAHWMEPHFALTGQANPPTIHDFSGFPPVMYQIQYQTAGAPDLAAQLQKRLPQWQLKLDQEWGYDHGTWCILRHMYPNADIPLLQLSLNSQANAQAHFELGRDLTALREEGVLIIGSGNIVHHLGRLTQQTQAYPWAQAFQDQFLEKLLTRDFAALIDFEHMEHAALAIPTAEHYLPVLPILGAIEDDDHLRVLNHDLEMGSISMFSFIAE
jgi:4,5-DOPA dioxygenase extradiol